MIEAIRTAVDNTPQWLVLLIWGSGFIFGMMMNNIKRNREEDDFE